MSLNTADKEFRQRGREKELNHSVSPSLFLLITVYCVSVCCSESPCDMNAEVSIKEEKRTSIALSTALLCPLSTPQVSHIGSCLLLSGWTNTHKHAGGGGGWGIECAQQHLNLIFADVIRSKWTHKQLQNSIKRPQQVLLILPDDGSEAARGLFLRNTEKPISYPNSAPLPPPNSQPKRLSCLPTSGEKYKPTLCTASSLFTLTHTRGSHYHLLDLI